MLAVYRRLVFAAFLCCLLPCGMLAAGRSFSLASPDGTLTLSVETGTALSYSLSMDGRVLIENSEISMSLDDGTIYGGSARVLKTERRSRDTVIPASFYKKSLVRDRFNELELKFRAFSLLLRLYDDGFAYRFVSGAKKPFTVLGEQAEFHLPERTWAYVPYVKGKGDFESQFFNSFENTYEYFHLPDWQDGRLAFLPLMLEYPNGVSACIMEADLRDYPGMFLYNQDASFTLKGVFAAVPDSVRQGGHNDLQMVVASRKDCIAECKGARAFPWRIVSVARRDADMADNDMVYRLAQAPEPGSDFTWVRPGKAAWEWWNNWNVRGEDFSGGSNTATYKHYIDFAAEYGLEYVLIDEGWSVRGTADLFKVVPSIDLPELVDYASRKGVGIILWAGYYAFDRDMERVCEHYSKMGIKGFKVDFMDSDNQTMVAFHERAARTCAKYHLLVDFHGTYKPTGLNRTWPNVINYEGVHGLEQCKWANHKTFDQVTYDVTMPFIRMAAGPVDYTQGAMRNAIKANFRGIYREPMSQGTRCRQLAEYVVFESPLTMLCDSPSNYRQEQECTEFIASVPTVWDETVAVDGEVARYIVIARRSGATWYVGALNGWDTRTLEIDLGFLPEGRWSVELFRDGANAARFASDYKKEVLPLPSDRKLKIKLAPGGGWAAKISPAAPVSEAEQAARSLLSKMMLQEKIGQMNQMRSSSGFITGPLSESISCDEAVKNGWCGAIVGLKNPEEMVRLQHLAVDSTRLGIPLLFGNDIIHGCRTIFPENIGISCTWDIDAVERFARVSAHEAAAFGTQWTFSPMCDISADPRWGRVSEGAGEDTYLAARIAEAMVRAYQGDDLSADTTILACVKHFAAYGAPEGGRDYNTVDMSWPMFRDRYLPVYQAAVDAGAGTVMAAFNDFDCIPVTANARLLSSLLRDSLKFGGFVVSDWGAVKELIAHGVAQDEADAARLAFRAGVNMDMVSGLYLKHMGELVASGIIEEKEIDRMVLPILKAKYELGLFDNPFRYGGREQEMYSASALETAREVARKSMVLLTNNAVLPLRKNAKIALVGPFADDGAEMLGAWKGMAEPERCISFRDGLAERFGVGNVACVKGCAPREEIPGGISEAVELARQSDAVLLTLGLPSAESGEAASLTSLELPSCQMELFRALKSTGKPVVVLLVTGRPLVLGDVAASADALLVTWHPGTMAGKALADLVSGDFSPSGRLSMGFPVSEGQLPLRYNAKRTGRPVRNPASAARFYSRYMDSPNTPLFVFGSGLSYTEFSYDALRVSEPDVRMGEDVRLSVAVTNTGSVAAEETVQVYVRDMAASTTRPARELKSFAKVFLEPGETREVPLVVRSGDLAFFTSSGKWEVEPGGFTVYVGHDSQAKLSASFRVLP